MKKSFLSKLLAGSISLGLLSGVNSVQNAFAVSDLSKEYEDIDEEDLILDEDYSKNSKNLYDDKSNNSTAGCLCRGACLMGDLIPVVGPVAGHVFFGTANETLAAWATGLAAYMAARTLPEVVFTAGEEKGKLGECFKKLENKDWDFNKDGEVIDKSNNEVLLDKDDAGLVKKAIEKAINKAKWAYYGPYVLYYLGWPAYDIIQLINKR